MKTTYCKDLFTLGCAPEFESILVLLSNLPRFFSFSLDYSTWITQLTACNLQYIVMDVDICDFDRDHGESATYPIELLASWVLLHLEARSLPRRRTYPDA